MKLGKEGGDYCGGGVAELCGLLRDGLTESGSCRGQGGIPDGSLGEDSGP